LSQLNHRLGSALWYQAWEEDEQGCTVFFRNWACGKFETIASGRISFGLTAGNLEDVQRHLRDERLMTS
jgi:hypothetical protein